LIFWIDALLTYRHGFHLKNCTFAPMWLKIAHIVIKHRIYFILSLVFITAFLGYKAKVGLELSYKFAKVVPKNDPDLAYFKKFSKTFGQDDNVIIIGVKDSSIYKIDAFEAYAELVSTLEGMEGIKQVLALPNLEGIVADRGEKRFVQKTFFSSFPDNQSILDSVMNMINNDQVYQGQIINPVNGAANIVISVESDYYQSKKRDNFMKTIISLTEVFEEKTQVKTYIAGLPYVRTMLSKQVAKELNLFLALSVLVTAMVLYFFFRSFNTVFVSLLIIGVSVVWSVGTIASFGYKITLLTGLIPPILVVIGIPNCVYLLNKYHQEFDKHKNKIKALSTVIRKIGMVTLITNFTTAIGFLALTFNDIDILREFGTVAGINIMVTFLISVILIPSIYTYLPAPKKRHLKHLQFQGLNNFLKGLEWIVMTKRKTVYITTVFLVVTGLFGVWKISALSFMVDDIPESGKIVQDLRFFEKNFNGVMPLELVIETDDKRAVTKSSMIRKLDDIHYFLAGLPELSEPISALNLLKASRQAYWGGGKDFYDIPTRQDKNNIFSYIKKSGELVGIEGTEKNSLLYSDSTGQQIRVSLKVADIGSKRLHFLIDSVIKPKVEEILKPKDGTSYHITGTTPLFIKGNRFLIENLRTSLMIAFVLIAIIMGILFMNYKVVVISFIPNLIPLIFTGALMGYFNIPLKPSTALIFTIAFGISVDDSIHFLAKYRQELLQNKLSVKNAISVSIKETGASMMYTSIILFFGFIIFAFSNFEGTIMLGLLTSMTLLFAMLTNLILLPSLLLTFDDGKRKDVHVLIDDYEKMDEEEVVIEK